MDNIYNDYPSSVEVDGVEYSVMLDYDRVLRAVDCCTDPLLLDEDKVDVQAQLLIVDPPKDLRLCSRIITAIFDLFPKGEKGQRYMDFHQDAALIRSGFMRAYRMDLTKEHPHFFQFLELLADLPKDTAFMRTVDLRRRPLPKPNKHNAEEIAELQKAKAAVAIRMSEEEREALFAQSLKTVFQNMKG